MKAAIGVGLLGVWLCLLPVSIVSAQVRSDKVSLEQPPHPPAERPQRRSGDFRIPDKLQVGDRAPDFTLKSPDGKVTVKLSSHQGHKPVALVFGSYT